MPFSADDIAKLWHEIGWPLLAIIALGGWLWVLNKHGLDWITADKGLKARMELLEQHVDECNKGRLDDAEDIGKLKAEQRELQRRLGGLTEAFRKGFLKMKGVMPDDD